MSPAAALVWFRQDLRLDDNPALLAGLALGAAVVPVFIWDPEAEAEWALGGASRCWLHGALHNLDAALRAKGSRLIVRRGDSLQTLLELIEEIGAHAVFWNRRSEPLLAARDRQADAVLSGRGVRVETFNSLLLFEPWTVETKSGTPNKVFTPFHRARRALPDAGSGPDAAPFFRIFNPIRQAEQFDPQGQYVRRWVPELHKLPDRWIHKPWQAPSSVLREADVTLGRSYPFPVVDHAEARARALALFRQNRENDASPDAQRTP